MEGRKVPGIRFEGFEEEWEQRKLGNVTVKIGSERHHLVETMHMLILELR